MDQKPWPWRKKSSEKPIITAENTNLTSKENGEVTLICLYSESHFYIVFIFFQLLCNLVSLYDYSMNALDALTFIFIHLLSYLF